IRSMRETRRILLYLRKARTNVARDGRRSASAGGVISFMMGTCFLKDAGDDLVQRRILNAHIDHGVAVENHAENLGDARPLDLEINDRPGAAADFAEGLQVGRWPRAVEVELHQLRAAKLCRN